MNLICPKVSIITLNWNQYLDTKECLESLSKINYQNYEIIIVDNGSKDGSFEKLKSEFPKHIYIKNDKNLGFAEGNNIGIKYAIKHGCDYLLLLNNDTIVDSEFLSRMIEPAEKDISVGAVGPKIYFYSNPKIIWFAGGIIRRLSGRTYHIGINKEDHGQYEKERIVDFLTGCAFLVRKNIVEEIGGLDPDYFNNFEDVDWSLRIRRMGYKLIYNPKAKIWHKWSVSFGGRFSPFYTYYKTRNSLLYLKKNKMPFSNFVYAFTVFPLKMFFYSIMGLRFDNVFAVAVAIKDYFYGKYGEGTVFSK